jgi:hypothetical protein
MYQTWTTKWIPAAVMTGYGVIDAYLILVVISVVRKCEGDDPPYEGEPALKAHRQSSDQIN